jgi:pimeloyl-ACP methyl ester carboxylesterase
MTATKPPILFIHGAWHNGRHWQKVAAELSAAGRETLCIDLPGHGVSYDRSRTAAVTVDEAASAVLESIRHLRVKPIVVGHSIGGVIITRAGEREPELMGHLVYLSGHLPIGLKAPAAYAQLPEWRTGYGETLFVGDPARTGVVSINPEGDETYLEQLREAYYNDVAFADFLPYARALTPDLPVGFWIDETIVSAARWGRIPRTYIRCTQDRALSPAIQSLMIRDADVLTPGNRFRVIDLESSHSPFASMPRQLADILGGIEAV